MNIFLKTSLNIIKRQQFLLVPIMFIVIVILTIILNQQLTRKKQKETFTTGAILISPSPKRHSDYLTEVLITMSPIKEDGFLLEFDFKHNRFSVTLTPPSETSFNKFMSWVEKHNFKEISLSEFYFENYSVK